MVHGNYDGDLEKVVTAMLIRSDTEYVFWNGRCFLDT